MSRRLRDRIPMTTSKLQPQHTVPSVVTQNIVERKQKAKAHYDKRASKQLSEFAIGERVFVKPSPRNRSKPWIHGEVVSKPVPRSCLFVGITHKLGKHPPIRCTAIVNRYQSILMQHQIHLSRWTTLQVQTAVEQNRWSSPSMWTLNIMHHRKSCCRGRLGTGNYPPDSKII